MEAMQAQSVDVVKRMKEITQVMQTPEEVLEAQGVNPEDIEGIFIFRATHSCLLGLGFCFLVVSFSELFCSIF